ncbi:MAG: tRNA (guanosine(37)-N1)-methyltransferase TrmD [Bacteroidota bacterium]
MRIDIVTGFPKLLTGPLNESMIRQAKRKKIVRVKVHDLRKYTHDRHKTIDDTPYGGGAGMVLKPEPIFECVEYLRSRRKYDEVVYLTADGEKLNQKIANELSLKENMIFLCGHYKGIDERVRERLVTREISIGDYVLTGGELAACVLADAVIRLIPGVLGDGESLLTDSFQENLLGAPQYTKPASYKSMDVPGVLLNGNHKEIERWRRNQQQERTQKRRKDLLS